MKFTKIDKKTAKIFLNNLKEKKHMICYVYFNLNFDGEAIKEIDIAQTYYDDKGNFYINSRGQGYLDYLAFEYCKPFKEGEIDIIIKTIHSFLECEDPGL
jgi:midasin (ATPase involved in ribosome maturation)